MRLRHLSVNNFRGIRELDWPLPDRTLFCLVGRGDSTKSTVLEAIRRVFYPQWNLAFDDADFYECEPSNTIKIEAVIGDIGDDFRDLEKYGHWLSGWDAPGRQRRPEPGEGLEDTLRVRLSVGSDLEPSWRVIKRDDDEGVSFKAPDRGKVAVSLIGAFSDRHLTWSRGSLLGHLTEGDNLSLSLADTARAAKSALEQQRAETLTKFDIVAGKAEATARSLGVQVATSYKAHLDSDAISIHVGGLAIHDGAMPLRQLGTGSKRMLTTGLQKQTLRIGHITLFDEVEIGLEPHRIARLVKHLKDDVTGQYFLTTHSPVVLRELGVDDLYIVHSRTGRTEVIAANKPAIAGSIQGKIRSGAEAFLAPNIVVCEGATEAGFLRGLDDHWIAQGKASFAYQGLAVFDANGASKVRDIADCLRELSYEVAVLADSDRPDQFAPADVDYLRNKDVKVIVWDDGMSVEERVFIDVPWDTAVSSFEIACSFGETRDRLVDQVQTAYGSGFERNTAGWTDHVRLRKALGKAAKDGDWYKRQDRAQEWAKIVSGCFNEATVGNADLVTKLTELRAWIDRA